MLKMLFTEVTPRIWQGILLLTENGSKIISRGIIKMSVILMALAGEIFVVSSVAAKIYGAFWYDSIEGIFQREKCSPHHTVFIRSRSLANTT
jgi:hypothetical protein